MRLAAGHHGGGQGLSRRRFASKRMWTLAAILLALVASVLAFDRLSSSRVASSAEERAKSLLELLQLRSPSPRTEANLTKTKQRAAARTHEETSPNIRMPREILPPPSVFDLVATPLPVTKALEFAAVAPIGEQAPVPGTISTPPPPSFTPFVAPPSTPIPTTTPPGPVPEPSAWATMLLGFAIIGWKVRRPSFAREVAAVRQATPSA